MNATDTPCALTTNTDLTELDSAIFTPDKHRDKLSSPFKHRCPYGLLRPGRALRIRLAQKPVMQSYEPGAISFFHLVINAPDDALAKTLVADICKLNLKKGLLKRLVDEVSRA
jgi:hypothetical protein